MAKEKGAPMMTETTVIFEDDEAPATWIEAGWRIETANGGEFRFEEAERCHARADWLDIGEDD